MGILFLILFTLAEIALVILTFTKFREKSAWRKNRVIVRVIEAALLLGMVLLPFTHMKWRFLFALVVVFIRLLLSGIVWLATRKKASDLRRKPAAIVSCIFSIVLICISLIPAFLFTNYNGLPVTGEYKVNTVSTILVDESRLDEFENDGSFREIPAHFYYPENADGEYPLIIFSHGAFGYYQSNYSTYAELASNGYVVVALDHPHHSFFTKDTDGKNVIADMKFINDVMEINEDDKNNEKVFTLSQEWLKLRTADESFVIDSIKTAKSSKAVGDEWHTDEKETLISVLDKTNTDKIGLMGHSLGGASSVALGRERGDITAVIDLDGTMLGEITAVENGKNVYNSEPYPIPVLDFTKESDYNDRVQYKSENGYAYVNEYVVENAFDGRTVVFADAGHMDFTDLPLISSTLASMLGHGDVNSEEMLTQINGIVLNWFDYYLKNEGALNIQANY